MSHFPFFVISAIVVLCTVSVYGDILFPNPLNNGNFIDDFFGSSDSELIPSSDREKAEKLIKINHAVPRYTFFTSGFTVTRVPARFCLPRGFESTSSSVGNVSGSVEEETFSSSGEKREGTYTMDQCDWSDYAESLLLIAFVAFLFAVIIFPFMFCGITLGRCCCFGRYKPTPNLCGGEYQDFNVITDGYSDGCVLALFIVSIACAVVMAAGTGVGIWGSVVMTNNVYDMANFTNVTAHSFVDVIDSVISILRSLNQVQNISEVVSMETLDEAEGIGERVTNATDFLAEYIYLIDMPRQVFMYVTLLLPLILMILVIISRFICPCLSYGMYFGGFILTALSLATFGGLYPMSSGLADVCVFIDNSIADADHDSFLNSIFRCGSESTLARVSEEVVDVFETAGNITCNIYDVLNVLSLPCDENNDGYINPSELCPMIHLDNSECDLNTISEVTRGATIYNRKIGCYCETETPLIYSLVPGTCGNFESLYETCGTTDPGVKCSPMYCSGTDDSLKISVEECAGNCFDKELAANATAILNYSSIAADIFDLYNVKVRPYLNCESAASIASRAKDFICVNMINSVTPMYVGEILGAAGCFVGTFVALLSTKRFNKNYRMSYALRKERPVDIEL